MTHDTRPPASYRSLPQRELSLAAPTRAIARCPNASYRSQGTEIIVGFGATYGGGFST
ncbi:hypothetical protein GCM10025862_30030 [Arsenicicoccus piscis]|uniref:Uncharacterized protein n=1 Tax=Arsenicicoccus piscis TaxID=673954 RepID=A0ABQ6HRK1_9MICO|nr:hypothetical protein GCM10025862_30030 [Arsenicicoccus piscis]